MEIQASQCIAQQCSNSAKILFRAKGKREASQFFSEIVEFLQEAIVAQKEARHSTPN
jgi:hypothetical protein